MNTNFRDVRKFPALSRPYHSSSFRARWVLKKFCGPLPSKRRATLHSHLSDEEVGLHGVWDAQGGELREEETGQTKYQTKLQKMNCERTDNFRLFPFHIRMKSSALKWSSLLMTTFQDVCKLTAICRLFHSSSFGASFLVSTKEFLWDLSFNLKNLFCRSFWPWNLTNIARIRRAGKGEVNQVW